MLRPSRTSTLRLRLTAALAALAPLGNVATGEDWPTDQHNAQRNAYSSEQVDPSLLELAWTYQSANPPSPAWHGPAKWDAYSDVRTHSMRNYDEVFRVICADDDVYFGSSVDDSVTALNAANGEEKWAFVTDGPVRIAPTFNDRKLYFGSDDGYAYCISADDGELVWKYRPHSPERLLLNNGRFVPPSPIRSGVIVDRGVAYFAASLLPWQTSTLCAIDAATGKNEGEGLFVKDLDGMTFEGPLALSDRLIIAPQGRVPPALFARAAGKPLGSLDGGGGSFVVVLPNREIVHGPGNKAGWVQVSDSESREKLATHENARALVLDPQHTYVLTHNGLAAIDTSTRIESWRKPCDEGLSLIGVGATLFVGKLNRVEAYATSDGELLWEAPVDGKAIGLSFANNRLLVSTDLGNIAAFLPTAARNSPKPLNRPVADAASDVAAQTPSPGQVAVGPWLQFTKPTEAVVRWQTAHPSPTHLAYRLGPESVGRVDDPTLKTNHEATLTSLVRNRLYHYSIEFATEGKLVKTAELECDQFFNYCVADVASAADSSPETTRRDEPDDRSLYREAAQDILAQSGVDRGLCLDWNAGSCRLAEELIRQSQLRILAVCNTPAEAASARERFRQLGWYGSRVVVRHAVQLSELALTTHWANLVVSGGALTDPEQLPPLDDRLQSVLTPAGMALLKSAPSDPWTTIQGRPFEGAGEWQAMYGRANNAAYGGESLAGARTSNDLAVQWVGRPGPRYQADRSGRKTPPLAFGGRLFLEGLHRIVTLDIYNGSVLWSLEVPTFARFNMPRDCANWCGAGERLFAAVRDRCWSIDARNGQIAHQFAIPPEIAERGAFDWGYVGAVGDVLVGSAVKQGAVYTDFWLGPGWYDASEGPETYKVCSDALFGYDKTSGERLWTYSQGLVVNSTITISDDRAFFVEGRGEALVAADTRRVEAAALERSQYLVAIDLATGKVQWETPLDVAKGTSATFMAHSAGKLVIVTSAQGEFHVYARADDSGDPLWDAICPWGRDGKADHGSHLSRPAIVGDRLFVRPTVFDLATGTVRDERIPEGKCGTYACTDYALFYRGDPEARFAMWSSTDNQYSQWTRLRPDCWLSSIPAGGMLLTPEGGGGCSCGSWMETSIGFIPTARLP